MTCSPTSFLVENALPTDLRAGTDAQAGSRTPSPAPCIAGAGNRHATARRSRSFPVSTDRTYGRGASRSARAITSSGVALPAGPAGPARPPPLQNPADATRAAPPQPIRLSTAVRQSDAGAMTMANWQATKLQWRKGCRQPVLQELCSISGPPIPSRRRDHMPQTVISPQKNGHYNPTVKLRAVADDRTLAA